MSRPSRRSRTGWRSPSCRVPGVHDLHGGVLGEVATYLPGRRVTGVRLRDGDTQVHLVLSWGAPIASTTDEVRVRVAAIVPGTVHVAVEDIAAPAWHRAPHDHHDQQRRPGCPRAPRREARRLRAAHPDLGGDTEAFIGVVRAFEHLAGVRSGSPRA